MQESGLAEIIPFICISALLGQYPVFFTSWAPLGLIIGSVCSLMAARSQVVFFLSALKAHVGGLPSLMTVTSCLPIWQKILHSSVPPMVRNLTHIWATINDQFLSQDTGRLIPDQVKLLLDMSLQVLISGLDPLIGNKKLSGSSIF